MRLFLQHLALLAILFSASCKKDVDDTAPIIELLSPNDGQLLTLPDQLTVEAKVSDDVKLDFVSFGLVDADGRRYDERVSISSPENPYAFNLSIEVDDLDIETGTYFLEVIASDGENDARAAVALDVIGIPKVWEGTAMVQGESGTESLLYIDLLGNERAYLEDHEGLHYAVDDRESAFFVFASSDERVRHYGVESEQEDWSVDLVLSPNEELIFSRFDDVKARAVFLSNQGLYEVNRFGQLVGVVDLPLDYAAQCMAFDDLHYWVGADSNDGWRLSKIFRTTGFEIEHYALDFEPRLIDFISEEKLILIDENGDVKIFDTMSETITPFPSAINEAVEFLVTEDGRAYFASTESVHVYNLGSFTAIEVHQGQGIDGLSWDEVNANLLVAEDGELRVFNPFPWQELGAQMIPNSVSELRAVFNK